MLEDQPKKETMFSVYMNLIGYHLLYISLVFYHENQSFNKKFDKDKNEYKSENKSFDRSRGNDKYDSRNPKEKSDSKFDKKDKQHKKTFDRYRDDSRPSELAASKVSRSFVKPKFDKFPKRDKFRNKEENKSPSAPRRSHPKSAEGLERLNKHIANAGICSRREADDLIASGVISVNGKVITEIGYKIKSTDIIT